jgi:ABC-type polysaccharide/polyol phosphate export permease
MGNESAHPSLSYATPASTQRRWPSLSTPVAIVVIVCGTLLIATPVVVACVMHGQSPYSMPDYLVFLLVATGAAGLLIVVLGILLAALRRPAGEPAA